MTSPSPDPDGRVWADRALRLIAAAAFLVPADRRWEFRAEWTAEVEHRAMRTSRGAGWRLLARAAGCLAHACWLRRNEWRLQMIWQDLRYGLRVLLRRPAFTVLSTLTLALAIGALTAVFSVVYGVLLRPLPYREPDRLVQIWENNPVKGWIDNIVAPANLLDWRARTNTFEGISCYVGSAGHDAGTGTPTLTGSGEAETVRTLQTCANIFDVLGVSPALGRGFAIADTQASEHAVVITDAFWRRRFGARPDIIGQTIRLSGETHQIVGVLPAGLRLPGADVDLWTPRAIERPPDSEQRRAHYLRVIGRIKPGVTVAQARDDIQRVMRQLSTEYPDTNKTMGADIGALQEWIVGGIRRKLLLFLAAVGFVLLIACTNVASLLMAQSIERARELALRAALGARRGRLIRQLVTESLLLSVLGSIAGVVLAVWAVRAFVALGPADVPRLADVRVDGVMLAFAIVSGVATTLLFGLLPAAHAARLDVMRVLRDGGRGAGAGLRSQRARRVLVAAEVTLSVMLVICAGLLIRSFVRLQQVDSGLTTAEHLLTFQLTLPQTQYGDDPKAIAFYERLLARLDTLPGVRAVGSTNRLPLTGLVWTGDSTIEGRSPDDYITETRHKTVSTNYFNAAGLRILKGRGFAASDTATAAKVVIVNEALARRFFAREEPVGQRITFSKPSIKSDWLTIVGVVADERQDGLAEPVKPEIYQPMGQDAWLTMGVVLRSDTPPETLIAPVREMIRGLNPDLVMQQPRSFDTLIASSVAPQRFAMLLMSAFATIALLLAVIGVYGVVSYSVKQRTPEIGVRLALGASPRQVSRLIVRQSLMPVFAGLIAGLVLASLATRLLAYQLFEVSPIDPATFGVVAVILLAAALLASIIPARRAMRVDPVDALRAE